MSYKITPSPTFFRSYYICEVIEVIHVYGFEDATVFESTTLYSVLQPKELNCFTKTVGTFLTV